MLPAGRYFPVDLLVQVALHLIPDHDHPPVLLVREALVLQEVLVVLVVQVDLVPQFFQSYQAIQVCHVLLLAPENQVVLVDLVSTETFYYRWL